MSISAKAIAFLHTSTVHIATFDRLLSELAPDIQARHMVNERLLQEARKQGGITPQLRKQVQEELVAAAQHADVVVCTCSSIGSVAEMLTSENEKTFLRIDRPMAEEAVRRWSRIIVAATVSSTLQPTRALLLDVAHHQQKEVQLIDALCADAWQQFELGNREAYLMAIAEQLQQVAEMGDGIVLAQASMAEALRYCPNLGTPVLASPRSGLEAAIALVRATGGIV